MTFESLPVKLENVADYVYRCEIENSQRDKKQVPSDPSRRWFKKDAVSECVDKCKYELYRTAMEEAGMTRDGAMNDAQRTVHIRYALLQSECTNVCSN